MKNQSRISDNFLQIENVLRRYLDLLYTGEINLIDTVFLPEATLSYNPIQKLLNDKKINFLIKS